MSEVVKILIKEYPEAECALSFNNLFELLVSVILSAQTTDARVNMVSPALFEKYPDPESLARAKKSDVEIIIKTIGMYRQKSKNIIAMSNKLVENFNGQVPDNYDDLISLEGVGRKTANVLLSVGFGKQRIAVDTHVFRVSNRIGLCDEPNVLKTELSLMENIPEEHWTEMHHALIWHGRRVCSARRPDCGNCPLNNICLHYKKNI